MNIRTTLFVFLILSSAISFAQQSPPVVPTRAEVQALLQSREARDQAWGAYWASQSKFALPEIRKNLESHLTGIKEEPDFAVIDNSLDALIQIPGEPLPVDLIDSIYRTGRRTEALILLTHVTPGTSVDHFLLDLLDKEAGQGYSPEWFAAADIMLMEHRPGLVHSLLWGLAIQGYVVVLIQQLRDRGFLTPDEFNDVSTPRLKIVVEDQRSEKTPLQ